MRHAAELRGLLLVLGRAAGLSGLALATLGSASCSCWEGNECASLDDLRATRAAAVTAASSGGSASSTAGGSSASGGQAIANAWDGMTCPTPAQYQAIVELKYPGRYLEITATAKDLENGKCCYHLEEQCLGGRPFLVSGAPRVATLIAADSGLAPDDRTPWLADAQMEYASVAAFARLSLQLLALGAPVDLVRDAQRASLDELDHAELFFELASRAGGASLRSGALDVTGALDDLSLEGLIESNLREGCIGETLAAAELRARAHQLDDPSLRARLLRVVDDETRHAELAFRILGWCRDVAPELTRSTLRRVLAERSRTPREPRVWAEVLSPLFGALS